MESGIIVGVIRRHKLAITVNSILFLAICFGAYVLFIHHANTLGMQDSIIKKANFTVYYPTNLAKQSPVVPVASSLEYNASNFAITYTVVVHGKSVVVTEQTTPDEFSQNGVYAYKLNQSHEYDSFDSAAGNIALTKPTELNGQVVAWDNTNGTLILAHSTQSLNKQEWELLFNSMEVVR